MFRPYHWRLQPAWWYRIWRWRGRLGVTQPSTHMLSTFLCITHSPLLPGLAFQAQGAGAFLCTSGRSCTVLAAHAPASTFPAPPPAPHACGRSAPRFAPAPAPPPLRVCSLDLRPQPAPLHKQAPLKPRPHFQQTSRPQTLRAQMLISYLTFSTSAHGPVRRGRKRRESLRGERKQPNQDGAEQPASPPFDSVRSMPYHTRRV